MDRFTYWNPTKLILKGEVSALSDELKHYGKTYYLYMVEAVLNETAFMTKLSAS